jgi:hypothetical protein
MATYGTQADLARYLGVSRSAISNAFRQHGIERPSEKKFDLDYYAYILRNKQEKTRVDGQRRFKELGAGVVRKKQTPKALRMAINQLGPLFDKVIESALQGYIDEGIDQPGLVQALDYMLGFYIAFIEEVDKTYPPDLIDTIAPLNTIGLWMDLEGDTEALLKEILGLDSNKQNFDQGYQGVNSEAEDRE